MNSKIDLMQKPGSGSKTKQGEPSVEREKKTSVHPRTCIKAYTVCGDRRRICSIQKRTTKSHYNVIWNAGYSLSNKITFESEHCPFSCSKRIRMMMIVFVTRIASVRSIEANRSRIIKSPL